MATPTAEADPKTTNWRPLAPFDKLASPQLSGQGPKGFSPAVSNAVQVLSVPVPTVPMHRVRLAILCFSCFLSFIVNSTTFFYFLRFLIW